MESIQVRERSSPDVRCAYCHDSLADTPEVFRCQRCHVELHRDCRRQLGRCPTLGCLASALRPLALPTIPRIREDARVVSPRAALFWLAATPAFGVVLTYLAALLLMGVFAAEILTRPSYRTPDPSSAMLGVFGVLASFLGSLGVVWLRRTLARTRALLREPGHEVRTLVEWHGGAGYRIVGLEASPGQGGPAWIPIEPLPVFALGPGREGRRPVRVRGLGGDLMLLETEQGWLSLATPATTPTPRPPVRHRGPRPGGP